MERFKHFFVKHFEKIVVSVIIMVAFVGMYFIEEKSIVLNFYYLPVISAGYFIGRRMGVLTAVLSILIVVNYVLFFPQTFFKTNESFFNNLAQLSSWGGFLILVGITVGTLYEQKERNLQDLKNAYIGILEILLKYLESTDRYTKGHSVRVSELAMEIAIAMELPRGEVENIRVGGLLHDIGKIDISCEVLRKATKLTSEERKLIDEHSVKGANLLFSVGSVLQEVVPIVLSHHQYFMIGLNEDNKRLSNIPLGARVIAVADTFDAMTSDRPYRKGMSPWQALEEIIKNAGNQFDPKVVEALKWVMREKIGKC